MPERSGQLDGTAGDGNRFGRIHAWGFHLCGKPEIAWAGGTIAVWTDSSGGWFHPVSPSADTDGKVHCRFRLWRVFTGQVAGNRTERSRIFLQNRYRFLGARYLNGTGSTAVIIVDGRFDTAYPFKSFAGRSFIHICREEAGRTKNFRMQGKRHRRAVCPSCRISCVLPPVSPS